jgi:transcriptional regulator with XRE-family HTH domain
MDLRQIFAANLRRLRHAKGLSQEDLAYEADVNRSYMSKLEKGTSYAGLEIMGKLATVLGVEPAELLKLPPKKGRAVDKRGQRRLPL